MAKPTKTPLPRLSAPPPGMMAFAEGGKPETADELMARIAGKYGVTGQMPTAPVQQTQQRRQGQAQQGPQQVQIVHRCGAAGRPRPSGTAPAARRIRP